MEQSESMHEVITARNNWKHLKDKMVLLVNCYVNVLTLARLMLDKTATRKYQNHKKMKIFSLNRLIGKTH